MANDPTTIPLLMFGSMTMAVSMVLCFMSKRWATPVAYGAMWLCFLSGLVTIEMSTLLFWGLATAICVAIDVMLPPQVSRSCTGLYHIAGGSLAGAVVGMCANTMAGVIVGAALGAFFGALAFSRTQSGRPMHFPSSKFFNYLAAKGLPAIVLMSMLGQILIQLIAPLAQ